ncbi:MAG: WYL domain-containing protein [Moraxellaceae bacterium]
MRSLESPYSERLKDLTQLQRERLAYLEMKAFFCGGLMRADIEKRFGLAPAAASRDLHAYRDLNPGQLSYDAAQRRYVPSASFTPLFPFSIERILSWLLHGFGDGLDIQRNQIPCNGLPSLINPDFGLLATITRAIHQSLPLKVTYLSLSSGITERIIVPGALADNGSRWHVRAYDRERNHFGDFVLTRITHAQVIEETPHKHELLAEDQQWLRVIDLELSPHPGLHHPEAIAADYSMQNGVLRIQLRAALVGYALNQWSVDCSKEHALDPESHHLWLRNNQSLNGVESAVMAPGYSAELIGYVELIN